MSLPTLSIIDAKVQYGLRNVVGSPLSQDIRLSVYNDVLDFLQSKANWLCTKRVTAFDYLNNEIDYSLSNSLGITDFKQYKDLRSIKTTNLSHYKEFEEIDQTTFAVLEGQNNGNNLVAFEDRDNDKVMRVLARGQSDTIIDEMENLSTGRTWASDTTNSDATTLAVDDTRVKSGANCLKFDIDVSQSANNRATIYTSTSFATVIDGSDLLNNGYFRFWLGLHSLTAAQLALISSVTFIWGSEASVTPATRANYWERTVTTTINNGTFKATWNKMNFDWAGATKTGSPDETSLRYFEIILNFTAAMTDANNIRVDLIKMFKPQEMELVYFSTNFVTKSGVLQEHFTTDTFDGDEVLILPYRQLNMFINLALQRLYPMKERSNADYVRVTTELQEQLPLAILQDGEAITRESDPLQVDGNSSGRDDTYGNQW